MGDQINAYYKYDTSNLSQVEEEYDGFLNAPQLTQLPLATELGNHDCGYNTALYGQHFTLPNISEKYGQVSGDAYGDNAVDSESTGDGDYYFTYNNTLYMVLNTSCLSIAEHKAFLEETIQANPDVTWKVVSFHKSIYSVASHVTESDIVTLRNGLSPILSQLGIDIVLQGMQQAVEYYRVHYEEVGSHQCSLFPGVRQMMDTLKDAGLYMATATCKPVEVVTPILKEQGLFDYFDRIGGASMDESVDNKTDVIRLVLQDPRLAGKRILMVGDRQDDMQGAVNNQLPAAAVLYGYGSREELEPWNPVLLAQNCEELTQYILG